jgi:uncharacterized protein involved in oxidation of intracellular sulfur
VKLGIVISTNDAETVWNAFRLGNFSRKEGTETKVFLVGKGVEYEKASCEKFNTVGEAGKFISSGGVILACGTCIKARNQEGTNLCPISSMKDLYVLIAESDKIVSF